MNNNMIKRDYEYENLILKLGLKISYYRKLRGYTQEELAEKIDVSLTHLGTVEAPNGNKGISLKTLFKISQTLDIPMENFFKDI